MQNEFTYRIFPLGDSALTIDFGNVIDEKINKKIIALFKALQKEPLPGMIEAIPAYSSVSIVYNVSALRKKISGDETVYEWVKEKTGDFLRGHTKIDESDPAIMNIPVCYDDEFAPDLPVIAKQKNISVEEIIKIHSSKQYRVYMLGFLPGFPYMGEIDERIAMPRKPHPQTVAAGSIGIAGRQTGIYPVLSPGGWSIIGRTSVQVFNAEKEEQILLKAGDIVEFYPVSKEDFLKMQS